MHTNNITHSNYTVTVDEALTIGQRAIKRPVNAVLIILFLLLVFFAKADIIPVWSKVMFVLTTLGLTMLWRSRAIAKWKIWAFSSVRNVHELKDRANRELSINWDSPSFLETKLSSTADKELLKELAYRFAEPDIFIDDPAIPDTVVISNSTTHGLTLVGVAVFMMGGLLAISAANSTNAPFIFLFLLVPAILGYVGIRKIQNKKPHIIISTAGIETRDEPLCSWDNITGEDIFTDNSGEDARYYLVYKRYGADTKYLLNNSDVDHHQLYKLLLLYRARHNQVNT